MGVVTGSASAFSEGLSYKRKSREVIEWEINNV